MRTTQFPMPTPRKPRHLPNTRINKAGLPDHVQRQLLIDIESPEHSLLRCKDLCARLPEIYGNSGSSLRRSVVNKYQWFKHLKFADPAEYWRLVALYRGEVEEESVSDQESVAEEAHERDGRHHAPWSSPRTKTEASRPECRAQSIMPTPFKEPPPSAAMNVYEEDMESEEVDGKLITILCCSCLLLRCSCCSLGRSFVRQTTRSST